MLAEEQEEFGEEEQFPDEARTMEERVRIPIGNAMHLAVKNYKWTRELIGETIYVYTLWILKRMGNDSMGSKINRKGLVEAELEIPLGEKGEDWKTISIAQWWAMMKENFIPHVFVSPIGIWEILMGRNQGVRYPRQKLRIGTTGNAGPGNPAINALAEVIEGIVGNRPIGEVQKGLANR